MTLVNIYTKFFRRWWRAIDRKILFTVISIMLIGIILVATASPAVARRTGLDDFYFIKKQLIFMTMAFSAMMLLSMMSASTITRLSFIGLILFSALTLFVLFFGFEAKGSKRWLSLFGMSIQPSEYMKPFFIIVTAKILSINKHIVEFPRFRVSGLIYFAIISLLFLQPDFGMVITYTIIWISQLFVAGISFFWIINTAIFIMLSIVVGYVFLPHVAKRINSFLYPENSINYQVTKSIDAFTDGGWLGLGVGEGKVKNILPDAHSDFIFAVLGEEMGLVSCLLLISLFVYIILRLTLFLTKENDRFIIYSIIGLMTQFAMQTIINMGVNLNLLPTKGMTLPFISSGGSSLIAVSCSMGMILSLTKKKNITQNNNMAFSNKITVKIH